MDKPTIYTNTYAPGERARRFIGRLGVLFSNFALLGVLLSFGSALSIVGVIVYYIILIIIGLATLFLLLANPEYRALFEGGDAINGYVAQAYALAPYVLSATLGCAILALIFLSFDKSWTKTKGAKTKAVVSLVLTILISIVYIVFKYYVLVD